MSEGEFDGLTYSGVKQGGEKEGDNFGGEYQDSDNNKYLVKRDNKDPANDIAEFIAAKIFEKIAPDYSPKIDLIKNETPQDQNQHPFIKSKFIEGFEDLYKKLNYTKREPINERGAVKNFFKNETDIKGYEEMMVSSFLVGDYSVHSGNIGVVQQGKDKNMYV